MNCCRARWTGAAALVVSLLVVSTAQAACKGFSWDVHEELALFASQPHVMHAGRAPAGAAQIRVDRFYVLQLTPQQRVHFEMPPGKTMLTDADYAGLVKFTVPQTGSYRISLDRPFWIDVVDDGKLLPTQDFQGQHGCSGPHKIVEFVMRAHRQLWLQFSGANASEVRVSITPAPTAAPSPH